MITSSYSFLILLFFWGGSGDVSNSDSEVSLIIFFLLCIFLLFVFLWIEVSDSDSEVSLTRIFLLCANCGRIISSSEEAFEATEQFDPTELSDTIESCLDGLFFFVPLGLPGLSAVFGFFCLITFGDL